MKLIEKECPNCGAGLSFSENDKSCKCEYCKREFEIERDTDKAKSLVDQFNLVPIKLFAKIFSVFTIGSFITSALIGFVTLLIFILLISGMIKAFNNKSTFNDEINLVEETTDLTDTDLETIDLSSKIAIIKNNDSLGDYSLKGSPKREKLYILYKKKKNLLISVYKTTYQNFFQKEFEYTIYVPVIFENVKSKNNSIAFSLGNGDIDAPEYYFNLEHSDYAYGYQDMDTLNKEIYEEFEGYTIEEK